MGRVSFIGRAAHATLHMILSEQVIGLGMGSWLDLWEKMIMYVLRNPSCACNVRLPLAQLFQVFDGSSYIPKAAHPCAEVSYR